MYDRFRGGSSQLYSSACAPTTSPSGVEAKAKVAVGEAGGERVTETRSRCGWRENRAFCDCVLRTYIPTRYMPSVLTKNVRTQTLKPFQNRSINWFSTRF
ncbi:hypothetical protein L596_002861 [Steinernema carpocapsae]|uniref:Uncharacterized protein n=1 Tax=Steinernema carpocapsae TaxID=34508 RepID=A0A4V6I7U7_STECR|nr:hypothetical protein L596_002861 [Steinernema carpocapsae]